MSKHVCAECGKGFYCKCGNPCGYQDQKNYCGRCRTKYWCRKCKKYSLLPVRSHDYFKHKKNVRRKRPDT